MRILILAAVFATVFAAAAHAEPLDYSQPHAWVCRPDAPCRDDLTATVIGPDGGRHREPFAPAEDPPIDCFYLYPTVSNGAGSSAPAVVTEDERRAVRQQVERLSSVCRLYAPLYRQITLTSMMAGAAGAPLPPDPQAGPRAQADVMAAWKHYLDHENQGRGVVLIGHSQGASMIIELIRREIDGAPLQARLVSAIVPGFFVLAPASRDVGGTFKAIPACRASAQTGCVLAWNSYRAQAPIPAALVMPVRDGLEPVCTNPASLAGGAGALKPYVSTAGETIIPQLTAPQGAWPGRDPETPFISPPGLKAECRHDDHGVWLAVTGGEDVTGDWIAAGKPDPTMGLHLLDLNLVQGNLVDILRAQAATYVSRRMKR
ncbi:MAG: DUF3089 domain-containing protein [Phenylobacterium sp.]|nr:DUF3089 domain-containing protein [Phenylobacterium sp.]